MRNLTAAIVVILLTIFVLYSKNQAVAQTASKPPRVEVYVTSVGAPAGSSKVTLQWVLTSVTPELQKMTSINPSTGALSWENRGITQQSGYYSYTEIVQNYTNSVYRVGYGGQWEEVRVYPPNVNAHANYSKNSDTCKSCHSTHYALHPKLLSHRVVFNLCITCHDGSGSKYNVLQGTVIISNGGMLSHVASPAGPFNSSATTSYHNVFLEADGLELMAPGGGKMSLTCTDCHSAHVTKNSSAFRLLKFKDKGPIQAYTHISGGTYNTVYINHMNDFCSECHQYYNYDTYKLGTELEAYQRVYNGEKVDRYRHPTGINIGGWLGAEIELPLEVRDGGRYMTCKTCHYAHGTTVIGEQTSGEPGMVKYDRTGRRIPGGQTTMLKRQSNMGICMQCHFDVTWNTSTPVRR